MSVIATVNVRAEDFLLQEVLTGEVDVVVRLDRVVPLGESFVPFFWAANTSVDTIETALRSELGVESCDVVATLDSESLIKVESAADPPGLLNMLSEAGATILEAVGDAGTWTIRLRFEGHDELTVFWRRCAERGIRIDLASVHNPGLPNVSRDFDLSDKQRETLLIALEQGYFDVPRRINLVNLAAEIGVSDTAVSQRLQRGISSLLTAYLTESEGERRT